MKRYYLIIALLFASTFILNAQKEGLSSINSSELKAYMTFFASSEMKGRETGSSTNEIAALYIKTNLLKLGLKPVAETNDYYQNIPLQSKEISNKETSLSIINSNLDIVYSTDSLVYIMPPSESMDVSGTVVFAGYGIQDKATGYDDFKDLDLKNKIVLVMTRNPKMAAWGEGNTVFDMEVEQPKLVQIFSKSPAAVLFVYDPQYAFPDAYASKLAEMAGGEVGKKSYKLKSEISMTIVIAGCIHNSTCG